MTESQKILIYEKKLQQLKEEEERILKILKDVRKQLKKYEVEELQTCSESVVKKEEEGEEEEQESDPESNVEDLQVLKRFIDCAKLVNNSSLNLELNSIFDNEGDIESEESEESD